MINIENTLMRFFINGKLVLETTSDKHDFMKGRELDPGDVFDFGEDNAVILEVDEKQPHNIIDYTIKILE